MNRFSHRPAVLLALLAAPLALTACAGISDDGDGLFGLGGDDDRSVSYRCDDDRRLRVTFNDDRDRATVEAGERTYRLRLEDRDGDQRRYGEDDVQLTVDGDEARLRVAGGRDYSNCEEI
jgi:hypothetical protein